MFYKAFNTPGRANDVFTLTGTKVPYLNGGLFENENPRSKNIDFPASYFEDVLNFFGQYNFTIDENDPQDHEVGIDPEMLGHIFENLLEDNKDKGAFYTPKPIVQYMCQESLIQYLKTYLQEKQLWPEQDDTAAQTEAHLQNFVRKKIAGELLNDYDENLARALKEVKICDPAIGSGAFPMGLLNEIFYCMQVLYYASPDTVGAVWEMEEWAPDIVKKNIIQHSIYGVDIEKGAVDIARLRFWLSLIVDEQQPTPLPNLDFKIMQGNSLLESYQGIDLSKISGNKSIVTEAPRDLFGNLINLQANIFSTKYIDDSNITELIDNYFNTQEQDKKQKLKKDIDIIIHNHIDYNLAVEEDEIQISITEIKSKLNLLKPDKNHSTAVAAKTNKIRTTLLKGLKNAEDELIQLKSSRKELHDLQKTAERPYFLWHLYFKDVFENGGFDIIIGNPPYNLEEDKNLKEQYKLIYKSLHFKINLFTCFIEQGISLMKPKGYFTFIIPNLFFGNDSQKFVREMVMRKTSPLFFMNLGDNVFESATVPTMIMGIINKVDTSNKFMIYPLVKRIDNVNTNYKFQEENLNVINNFNYVIETVNPLQKTLLFDIESISEDLENYLEINQGIITGNDEKYLSDTPKSNVWKPTARGKDMSAYLINYPDLFVYYNSSVLACPRSINLFNVNEKILLRRTGDYPVACYDNKGIYNLHTLYSCRSTGKYPLKFLLGLLNSRLFRFIL